jgi:uncharacterized protein (TIGR03435 family)
VKELLTNYDSATCSQTCNRRAKANELKEFPGGPGVANTTLYTLITMAYRIDVCPNAATTGRLSGGPGWVGEDQWDIEALIPIGTPNFTTGIQQR